MSKLSMEFGGEFIARVTTPVPKPPLGLEGAWS